MMYLLFRVNLHGSKNLLRHFNSATLLIEEFTVLNILLNTMSDIYNGYTRFKDIIENFLMAVL